MSVAGLREEEFRCPEFDGCRKNYCAYEGEEGCHWRNVPVDGCPCCALSSPGDAPEPPAEPTPVGASPSDGKEG